MTGREPGCMQRGSGEALSPGNSLLFGSTDGKKPTPAGFALSAVRMSMAPVARAAPLIRNYRHQGKVH